MAQVVRYYLTIRHSGCRILESKNGVRLSYGKYVTEQTPGTAALRGLHRGTSDDRDALDEEYEHHA